MNHVKQIISTPQFTDLPLDVSTIPRRVISSAHTHTHTQIRAHPLSQVRTKMPPGVSMTLSPTTLHLFCIRKRQTLKWRDDAVYLWATACFFSKAGVLVRSSVRVPGNALVDSERERGSQQRPVRASLHQQAGCLRYYPPNPRFLLFWHFPNLDTAHPI